MIDLHVPIVSAADCPSFVFLLSVNLLLCLLLVLSLRSLLCGSANNPIVICTSDWF